MPTRREPDKPAGLPAWIVSYGDLVTTLLCFFIILNALAEDQTGLKLHAGLASFKNRPLIPGVTGLFDRSHQPVPLDNPDPNLVPEALAEKDGTKTGAGQPNARGRIIDFEEERFQNFLGELNRQFFLKKLPPTVGETSLDVFDAPGTPPDRLTPSVRKAFWQVLPLLGRRDYEVTVVAWATMPSESAWLRAATGAARLADALRAEAGLSPEAAARVASAGRPWRFPDKTRPTVSIIVRRVRG